jgi:RES domain-containing protein
MRVWHIYNHKADHAKDPGFNPKLGLGGLHGSARWHHVGQPVLYTAPNPSLAMLEILVHVGAKNFDERKVIEFEVPRRSVETVSLAHFIQMLRDSPKNDEQKLTRDFGTQWLKEKRSLLLEVPSIIVPFENNFIVNPAHRSFAGLEFLRSETVRADWRLSEPDITETDTATPTEELTVPFGLFDLATTLTTMPVREARVRRTGTPFEMLSTTPFETEANATVISYDKEKPKPKAGKYYKLKTFRTKK